MIPLLFEAGLEGLCSEIWLVDCDKAEQLERLMMRDRCSEADAPVLQHLFNFSDEELEFQVNDRRSFEVFIGLGVMNTIPHATTVAFFLERLRKAGVIDELFDRFE
jgi:hypothetical protein